MCYYFLYYFFLFFFFNDSATTYIYTLSLHDALPISRTGQWPVRSDLPAARRATGTPAAACRDAAGKRRSEEHTSELQSHSDLVCRLLLEKKKNIILANKKRNNKD